MGNPRLPRAPPNPGFAPCLPELKRAVELEDPPMGDVRVVPCRDGPPEMPSLGCRGESTPVASASSDSGPAPESFRSPLVSGALAASGNATGDATAPLSGEADGAAGSAGMTASGGEFDSAGSSCACTNREKASNAQSTWTNPRRWFRWQFIARQCVPKIMRKSDGKAANILRRRNLNNPRASKASESRRDAGKIARRVNAWVRAERRQAAEGADRSLPQFYARYATNSDVPRDLFNC